MANNLKLMHLRDLRKVLGVTWIAKLSTPKDLWFNFIFQKPFKVLTYNWNTLN